MLSLQFISEFNKLMGASVSKKAIADAIGTSRSYITQLFSGDKLLNLQTIVNIQKALNAKLEIRLIPNESDKQDILITNRTIPLTKTVQKTSKEIAITITDKKKKIH